MEKRDAFVGFKTSGQTKANAQRLASLFGQKLSDYLNDVLHREIGRLQHLINRPEGTDQHPGLAHPLRRKGENNGQPQHS